VVDGVAGTLTSFINGTQVQQVSGPSVDGRWAIGSTVLLFADENSENSAGYVNSVQLRPEAMLATDIAALGGPTAAGIPIRSRPVYSTSSARTAVKIIKPAPRRPSRGR